MQKIRVGHRATNNALSLYANSKGKRAARDIALQTEWGNAAQEMNTSCDQEPLKWTQATDVATWNNAGGGGNYVFNNWALIEVPNIPRAPSGSACGRVGRTVQIKGLDVSFQVSCTYGAAEGVNVVQQPLVRVVVFIDKQPNLNTPAFDFDQLFNGGVGTNTQNVLDLFNQDYKDRFLVIADYEKQTSFFGNKARSSFSWIDHYDLDYTVTYSEAGTAGSEEEATTNLLGIAVLPRVARTTATDATTVCTISSLGRFTYTDM